MYALEDDRGNILSTHEDYDEAWDAAHRYATPDGLVGHDGDLEEGGEKTLIWDSEQAAENDAGVGACASIRRTKE
jgi:hypothetical protein